MGFGGDMYQVVFVFGVEGVGVDEIVQGVIDFFEVLGVVQFYLLQVDFGMW